MINSDLPTHSGQPFIAFIGGSSSSSSNTSGTDKAGADSADSADSAEVVVLVLDLLDSQAMSMAAQLSLEFTEVAKGLHVAQEVHMRLVLIAMARHKRQVSCLPVVDFEHLPQALEALCELIEAQQKAVTWVMVPEEMHSVVSAVLVKISEVWQTRTQGLLP